MARISVRHNGCFSARPSRKPVRKAPALPKWLVTATIGVWNNVQLTVPAADIITAGEYAGAVLEGTCAKVNNRPANYQIQSICQHP